MEKAFDEELYKMVSINDLIVFCIFSVVGKKEKCDFERLAQECFKMFPKTFSFSKIANWPDARKLDRPLRALREKRIINGASESFFTLTPAGEKAAETLNKIFRQRKLL